MKWFKHETDAVNSEKLNQLIDKAGLEGYGRFWRVLEVVAERMDDSNKCSVELSVRRWAELLHYPPKCRTDYIVSFFDLLRMCGLCEVDVDRHIDSTSGAHTEICIRTTIPNLLKKRDNYTKNLQAVGKKLASKEVEEEVDIDKKKKNTAPASHGANGTDPRIKQIIDHAAQTFQEQFGEKLPISAKDGANVKRLLKTYSQEQVTVAWDYYITANGKHGNWFRTQGITISNFSSDSNFSKCIVGEDRGVNQMGKFKDKDLF